LAVVEVGDDKRGEETKGDVESETKVKGLVWMVSEPLGDRNYPKILCVYHGEKKRERARARAADSRCRHWSKRS